MLGPEKEENLERNPKKIKRRILGRETGRGRKETWD